MSPNRLSPHKIRLHGPWLVTTVADDLETVSAGDQRISIQADWSSVLGKDFLGTARYRRNFNQPTGLEPDQPVKLVITEVDFFGRCFLNECELGTLEFGNGPASFEIQDQITDFNQIAIDVRLSTSEMASEKRLARAGMAGGLIGSVYLEIYETE